MAVCAILAHSRCGGLAIYYKVLSFQHSIGDRIMPPTAVLKTYDNNRIERFTEELEDMKAKLLKSEKENARKQSS
jgi:hypothetical protein